MKPFSLLITLLVFLGLGACRQQEAQPTLADEFPAVPTVVVQALRTAYPSAKDLSFTEIDKGNIWESAFTVQAINHQAKVNAKGTILEAYAVGNAAAGDKGPTSVTLPAAAKAYIDKTYPGYKLMAIGEGQYNNQKAYKVLLQNEKEAVTLIFDGNGALYLEFKEAVVSKPITVVADLPKTFPITKAEELPAAISQYLRDNGLTFAKGLASVDKADKKTWLIIATKETAIHELLFDNDGKLLKASSVAVPVPPVSNLKEKAITAATELPAIITDYLTKNYPNWVFMKGILTMNGEKPLSYLIVIKIDTTLYYVTFNGEGKFELAKKG
jgi:hypothetical protein